MTLGRVVIVGAGGLGREVLDILEAINERAPTYEVLGFLDDKGGDRELLARRGMTVLGRVDQLGLLDAEYIIAIGAAAPRRRIDAFAIEHGRHAASAIHPAATLGSHTVIGPGAIVAAGARLTTNIKLGRHVQIHTNATVGHDANLQDYVTVLPGANVGGSVTLEQDVTIGSGAVLIQGVTVGRLTTVGAGAVVVRDLPEGVTAVGVPARALGAQS
jgi:sugar O-acyltransferase (sialic acid O-acetyltransferase NeuD family)